MLSGESIGVVWRGFAGALARSRWATQRLRKFIVKGFALDDERLAEGGVKNGYFDKLLERVRDIRVRPEVCYNLTMVRKKSPKRSDPGRRSSARWMYGLTAEEAMCAVLSFDPKTWRTSKRGSK
jgi:hypothetical protein